MTESPLRQSEQIDRVMSIDGAVAAALVDWVEGEAVWSWADGSVDIEAALAGAIGVARTQSHVVSETGGEERLEDVLITVGPQFHVMRVSDTRPNLLIYLVLDRTTSNLALARHQLAAIASLL